MKKQTPTPALTVFSNMHHHDWKYNFVFKLANNEATYKIEQSPKITDLLRRPQTNQEDAPPRWQTYIVQYKMQYTNLLQNWVHEYFIKQGSQTSLNYRKSQLNFSDVYGTEIFVLAAVILFQ
jgi:hypothetical protein